jgi:putative membrane-bound dehydrogenase-like protein
MVINFVKVLKAMLFVVWLSLCVQCSNKPNSDHSIYDALTEEEKRQAENALSALSVEDGLEVSLFASEPMMHNPTNIDIDHRGRVWVAEGYNYRAQIVGNPAREEGDRILILEDTDGDGKADKETVFYQNKALDSPLGLLVLGNRVIVSQSPYIWMLTDEDGDDKADKMEIIFQGIEGVEHDHGVHAVVFGPDGKFYFNFGNYGKRLLDKNGDPVRDRFGNVIDFSSYQEGIVFRCDADFQNVEVLGHNFRNPYEVAVDSYGTMWQSDNDDDGNKGVRMNYVMQAGNFGFRDEMTGASWQTPRTNMEDSIPYRHWFQNDPGVIPNLLHTGAGSPTGLAVYEGTLLPEKFRNQLVHCDAGQNIVRAYPVEKAGAGYSATFAPILWSEKDQWFRPTDVCVAPDGSLMVSDWYDPSVGGHQIGDQERGRLYRVAPPDSPYTSPTFDFSTPGGAIDALANPNPATRYLAWEALKGMGLEAEEDLSTVFAANDTEPRLRARVLWILGQMDQVAEKYIQLALKDRNPDIRITAVRLLEQGDQSLLIKYAPQLVKDPDSQVRRELALALRYVSTTEAAPIWTSLALAHDGNDKWYLEALGIAADGRWDKMMEEWFKALGKDPKADDASKDIIWRSRSKSVIPFLADLAADPAVPIAQRLRYFRAFDFHADSDLKTRVLTDLVQEGFQKDDDDLLKWGLKHINPTAYKTSGEIRQLINKRLDQIQGSMEFVELVDRYTILEETDRLMAIVLNNTDENLRMKAASLTLKSGGVKKMEQVVDSGNKENIVSLLHAVGDNRSNEVVQLLANISLKESLEEAIRIEALKYMGTSDAGQDRLLKLLAENRFSEEVKASVARNLMGARREAVKAEAAKYLEQDVSTSSKHPPVAELIDQSGDVEKGRTVFNNYCGLCHQVAGVGDRFGPDLSEIGQKLPKEGMYAAIINPTAGISFGYEGYNVKLKDGTTVTGIIISRTDETLTLAFPGGNRHAYDMSEVASLQETSESLMPPGLENAMTTEELVNLVEYLVNLKSL